MLLEFKDIFLLLLLSYAVYLGYPLKDGIDIQKIKTLQHLKTFAKQPSHKIIPQSVPLYILKFKEAGLTYEEHKILTEDGYILTAWRINNKHYGEPVILQHGLFDSSYTWVMLENEYSLPILLAKEGYDVWLTNTRGNSLCYEHRNSKQFNANDIYSHYWDFSFHEMAIYDLPANIMYIKTITGHNKVNYISHSQGGLIYFILYTLNPEFIEENVKQFFSVGTVATVFTAESHLLHLTAYFDISNILKKINIQNFFVLNDKFHLLIHYFCRRLNKVCYSILNFVISNGKNTNRINPETLFEHFLYTPGGTSLKNIQHWLQVFKGKTLGMYDYGKEENLKRYGKSRPPVYDLKKFKHYKVKSTLYYSDSDPFSNENDLKQITQFLHKDIVEVKKLINYNHLDFLWSKDAKDDIYVEILSKLNKYK